MKKGSLLKALVIIVPVLIAIYAQFHEYKQQKQLSENIKIERFAELSNAN